MAYVDAFLTPVPVAREAEYLVWSQRSAQVMLDHGALGYVDCRGDDVPEGKVTSMPMAVKLEPGEVVYFSYVTYRDRAHRDEVMGAAMEDPRLASMTENAPAGLQRMIFGGFVPVVG